MAIGKLQVQLRIPWPDNPSGYYYWVQGMHYNTADPPPGGEPFPYWWSVFLNRITLMPVQRYGSRVETSPGSGVWAAPTFTPPSNGLFPSDGAFSLYACLLYRWLSGGSVVSSQLIRQPVLNAAMVGGKLDEGYRLYCEGIAGEPITKGRFYTADGHLIDGCYVDGGLHSWQLRHGTKRRNRMILPHP